MQADDASGVAAVHVRAFPGFFLSFLGHRFLRELYRGIADDPSGVAFVAEEAGACTGFVAGTVEPAGFYRRLLRRRLLTFAGCAFVASLRRPQTAPRLLRALVRHRACPPATSARAELMSLAVLPESRRAGTGARLVTEFNLEVSRRGSRVVFLTTDAVANDRVLAFYERLGFSRSRGHITPEGRRLHEYERCLA